MLPPAILSEEVDMGEQGHLFQSRPLPWVERLWRAIDPDKRHEVVLLLAEMARRSIARGADGAEEQHDEP